MEELPFLVRVVPDAHCLPFVVRVYKSHRERVCLGIDAPIIA